MISDAVWRRACPAGQVLDLLHARVTEPYAPHVHEEYAVGVCTAGREVIRYRGTLHYAGPGSVVVLEPGEAHTGAPADPPAFTYRVMYPAAGLLSDGMWRTPRFREPVIADPGLAAELRRLHAALGLGAQSLEAQPLDAESRWFRRVVGSTRASTATAFKTAPHGMGDADLVRRMTRMR